MIARTLGFALLAGTVLLAGAPAFAQSTSRVPVAATAARPAVASTAPAAAPEGVVNINSAGDEELQRLPGIGPARAAAIVALRQRVQRFRVAEDLLRVRGIGRAGMRRLRPFVSLNGETTLSARPGRNRADGGGGRGP